MATNRRVRLLDVRPSDVAGKKLTAVFRAGATVRKVHFGARGYGDFPRWWALDPAAARRKRAAYIRRHGATEDWRDPATPATLSRYVLWEKPSVAAAVRAFRRRFGV